MHRLLPLRPHLRRSPGPVRLAVVDRGAETRIVPDSGTTLRASSCVSCGACVDTCPTGALEDKTVLSLGAPDEMDAHDLSLLRRRLRDEVGTRDNRIVQVKPALDAPVNKGHLCVEGPLRFDLRARRTASRSR